ncbi:MAG: hypothetical protein DRJ05_00790 [Bacteroidetes bacterium]|nr:MAG: hypothetical protein DRJ05_00790 [Bacteroidota bacterium]
MKKLTYFLIFSFLFGSATKTFADYEIKQLTGNWSFWTSSCPVQLAQSFTSLGGGDLTEIEVRSRVNSLNTTLRIYLGESVLPADEIYSQAVTFSSYGLTNFTLTNPVSLIANTQYTFAFDDGCDNGGSILGGGGDLYTGGSAYLGHWWGSSDFYFIISVQSPYVIPHQWTGISDSDWNNTANWNDGVIPDNTADVIIEDGMPNYPIIDNIANAKSITLSIASSFTVNTGGSVNVLEDMVIGSGCSFTMHDGSCNISGKFMTRQNSTILINDGVLNMDYWVEGNSYWRYPKGNITLSGGNINVAQDVLFYYGMNGVMDGPFSLVVGGNFGTVENYWTTVTDGTITLTGTGGSSQYQCYSDSYYQPDRRTLVAPNLNIDASGIDYFLSNKNGSSDMHIINDFNLVNGNLTTINNTYSIDDTSGLIRVDGNLAIGAGATFTAINTDTTNTMISGNFSIASDVTSTGSWIDNEKFTVSGSTSVERYLTANNWHYVSPPVSGAQTGDFEDTWLKSWDESTNDWNPYITNLTDPLNVGEGYASWAGSSTGDVNVQYNGGVLNSNKYLLLPVTATDANIDMAIGDGEGWNFVGNPYPSAVMWNGWPNTNISPTVYLWDGSQAGLYGNYSTWNYNSGTGVNKTDGRIPAGQGFIVKATGFSPMLYINKDDLFHDTQTFYKKGNDPSYDKDEMQLLVTGNEVVAFDKNADIIMVQGENEFEHQPIIDMVKGIVKNKPTISVSGSSPALAPEYQSLRLKVEGNDYSDETVVMFADGATNGFDTDYDAYKLDGYEDAPQLFSIVGDLNLAVNTLSEITSELVVPLGFKVGVNGSYTITASGLESFNNNLPVYLEDLANNVIIDLNSVQTYTFDAQPGSPDQQFLLHFSELGTLNTTEILSTNEVEIYSHLHNVYVKAAGIEKGDVFVYDILGKQIDHSKLSGENLHKISLENQSGHFIVKFIGEGYFKTKKIYIQ